MWNKKKSRGWGKRGGWSDEGSLAHAQLHPAYPALWFYLTLFSPFFCSPEISEWVGETESARKVTVSDDRVRGRVTEEGADLEALDVIPDFYLVNWSSWHPSCDEGDRPAGLPAGCRTGATPTQQQGASFRRSGRLQVWMLMKPRSSSRFQPFHPRHPSRFCYSGRRHCHN